MEKIIMEKISFLSTGQAAHAWQLSNFAVTAEKTWIII